MSSELQAAYQVSCLTYDYDPNPATARRHSADEDTMIRQYGAQRCRGGDNPLRVGVIATGSILYLQDDDWWRDRYRGAPTCRNPWIVEGFLNGTLAAARRNRETGKWEDVFVSGRSDSAVIRSLRDGRRARVAVRILLMHEEHGLAKEPCLYPTLPDMRLWRVGRASPQPDAQPVPTTRLRDTAVRAPRTARRPRPATYAPSIQQARRDDVALATTA